MHVAVPYENRKDEPAHELVGALLARLRPKNRRDIGIAPMPVFVVRENTEDLGKILHVNGLCVWPAVKPSYHKGFAVHPRGFAR